MTGIWGEKSVIDIYGLLLFLWKAFLGFFGLWRIFGIGQIPGHKSFLSSTIFCSICWRSTVQLIHTLRNSWIHPWGAAAEVWKLWQAPGPSSRGLAVYLCLFPTWYRRVGGGGLTLCPAPGPGLTIEGHSGEKSVMPSFLEDQNVSLHVKFEDIQCLSKFWENTHIDTSLSGHFVLVQAGSPAGEWKPDHLWSTGLLWIFPGSQGVLLKFFQLVNCLCDDLTWGFPKTTA